MRVNDVLQRKGGDVVTITPDETVRTLVELLRDHRIGAVVVSSDGTSVNGIVSERDVVRRLADTGADVLDQPIGQIMTVEVHTCGPDDDIADLAEQMTERRIRHVPVLVEDRLTAIVSIGDVVKHRINQLTDERDQLEAYVQQ
ncbi:CBS domain-containing protein [Enemella evansiae]|uniref:Histidine kinase n=1 Tax=Enemella evansiae TaxID=2016499 RepID=A0A255G4U7_9ACTN|nr:CBS domain-containing protein [Enemella evansiae]PFG67049.1 CBS domain protein [Propionibacteriaceae bacterium ES.041]OYN98150.1 histidine kinase [Enemella evansiae]OYO02331.1 histidine kinase [Enemella evansiae]OYO05471.1 histidine kinase [Enemella evansiae]OYO10492.1 histidine kinase [Enemella evansiae]